MSSKPTRRSDSVARSRSRSAMPASTVATAASAVTRVRGSGKSFEHRRGHDAQRALRADEELLEVVAGVVLAQAAQAAVDAAVREHRFDAQRQLARVAVAQHRRAPGVGRKIAADRAAALRRERQREVESRGGGGLVHGRQRQARLDRDRRVGGVERPHARHPRERQHDLVGGRVRRRAAAQAGVAALRHDRDAELGAGARDRGHFVGRPGLHDRARGAAVAAAPVGTRTARRRRRRSAGARRRRCPPSGRARLRRGPP